MYMNRFFAFCAILVLSGCGVVPSSKDNSWFNEYGTLPVGNPAQMYGQYTIPADSDITHNIAVLLPMTGDNASVGRSIRTSIELAVLQNGPKNLTVSFYDTAKDADETIHNALATNPDVIIGPLFANNARTVREAKDSKLPVLSFTSDETAIGDGVMSMSLLPRNSIETIVSEMASSDRRAMIMLAPDTSVGHMMAGAAKSAAKIYNVPVQGIFFYESGNTDSIKDASAAAAMNAARTAANTKSREILSDILTTQRLTALEKSSLTQQLERISKSDTIGDLPYDAVLMLGSGDDAKTIASFLRYYGVGARDAQIYGTAMWDGTDVAQDFTLTGARFATMPDVKSAFSQSYSNITDATPSRLAAFGYDAANMAIGMIMSNKSNAAYLLDPSGYIGTNGLFRLMPSGTNERALRVMELDGSGTAKEIRPAQTNFLTPLYTMQSGKISPADAMELETAGVNPTDYINIPQRLRDQYKTKPFGANITYSSATTAESAPMTIVTPTEELTSFIAPGFTPVSLESVSREYIDSIEIIEE